MNKKGEIINMACATFVLIVGILLICMVIAEITVLDNETKEIIVDCYDKEGNQINEVNCTEIKYYCNKFQNFFLDNCLEEGE
jgi:hypothetical protein